MAGRILAGESKKKGGKIGGMRRTGMSYKKLGIPLESKDYGKLVLTQWSPGTDEVFMLREKEEPAGAAIATHRLPSGKRSAGQGKLFAATLSETGLLSPGVQVEEVKGSRTITLTRLVKGEEAPVGRATYAPLEGSVFVKDIGTMPAHRRRDVASSLLAYLKTYRKDIWLYPLGGAMPFYRRMGFRMSKKYGGYELPAGEQLPTKSRFERQRKFLITGKKK